MQKNAAAARHFFMPVRRLAYNSQPAFFAFTACDLCGALYIPVLASGHSQRNVLLDAVFFLPMSAGSAAAKASAAPTESSAASTRAS